MIWLSVFLELYKGFLGYEILARSSGENLDNDYALKIKVSKIPDQAFSWQVKLKNK